MLTHTHAHPRFEHVALLHDGPDDLARTLAPQVDEGMSDGEAVLVCLSGEMAEALRDHLSAPDAVTFMAGDVRYSRPGVAMAALHKVLDDPKVRAAPALWSIGAVPFDGSEDAGRWVRYEQAVDEVLGHAPLRAVCAYDHASIAEPVARQAFEAHRPANDTCPTETPPWAVEVPDAPPSLSVCNVSSAEARRALAGVLVESAALSDAQLVATELLANSTRHGREPVELDAWVDGARLVLRVTDAGEGVQDPLADLRALRPHRKGGYGLWLVGQLADAVSIGHERGRTVVTATLGLDPT